MPLVYRRLFTTSLTASSKSRRGAPDPLPSTSAFSERFGSPTQAQNAQAPFPAWPGAQTTQTSSHINPFSLRPPPPGLVGPENRANVELESLQDGTGRKRPAKYARPEEQKRVLFSDTIGNASAFVNTSSFEAKVAIEPAVDTYKRWMLAAKNNAERLRSLPEPAVHSIEPSDPDVERESSRPVPDDDLERKPVDPASESPPKISTQTSRSPIVTPSGRRMLSTLTTAPSLCLPQTTYCEGTTLASILRPKSTTPLWKECVRWMLTSAPDIRPYTLTSTTGFMRRFCASWPRSTQRLSFFQPTFPSFPVFSRGYATRRTSKPRIHPRQQPPELEPACILIPEPTSQTSLCNAIRHLFQSTSPPISVARLIATHAQYPTHQSLRSFNLLLEHAIRVAPTPYTERIIAQMRTRGIPWNMRTERLVVRAHIQSGRWLDAIKLSEKLWLNGTTSRTPLDIFAELLHFVLSRRATTTDIGIMAGRCWKLFPSGIDVSMIERSPRLAFNVVRLLVKTRRYDHAVQLTRKLFDSLASPNLQAIRFCRVILSQIIRPPEGDRHPPRFLEKQALLESLLSQNPALRLVPDANLTVALLENLFRSRNRGGTAFHTLQEMRLKYGPQVENSAARRLIARYAIEDGRIDLARDMFERERIARLDAPTVESLEFFPRVPWVVEDAIPTPSHLEYIRHIGTENAKWVSLARRLRRAEIKAGLVQTPDFGITPDAANILAAGKRALSMKRISKSRIRRKANRRAVRLRWRCGNTINKI